METLHLRPVVLACGALLGALAPHGAQAASAVQLVDLSLEQLANISVTSVSKRTQRLADVAGSVYVISGEDIRRSGVNTLPDALRLAPNLQVARVDANSYAISARGFNSATANRLLVLIDGRTVYSPLYSGVFWDAQDVLLEDIERIEVLSGSGGTLYGSNAVNGVINVITRPARDTQGTLLAAGYGDRERTAAARFGGTGELAGNYRVYGKYIARDDPVTAAGTAQRSASAKTQVGFRSDRDLGIQQFTLQGDAYEGGGEQALPNANRRIAGANLLARWSEDHGDGSSRRVQLYYDRTERRQPGTFQESLDTMDADLQWGSRPRPEHELLVGGGYRYQMDRVENVSALLAFLPPHKTLRLANIFVQDDYQFAPDWTLSGGLKLEHNSYTGLEYLPNLRLAWKLAPQHLLWGGVARTVRTPSRIDREAFLPGTPPFSVLAGGPDFQSEVTRVYELGYRAQPTPALSWSATVFHHDYERQRSVEPSPAGPVFGNLIEGHADGVEAWGSYRASDKWRLNAGVSTLRQKLHLAPGSASTAGTSSLGNDANHQWSLGSALDLPHNLEFDVSLRRVGSLPLPAVPAYTSLDARVSWRARPDLELSLSGQNLADRSHTEWGSLPGRAEFQRAFFLKATWRL